MHCLLIFLFPFFCHVYYPVQLPSTAYIVHSFSFDCSFYVHDEITKQFIMKIGSTRKTYKTFLWSMSKILQFNLGSSNYEVIAIPMVYFSDHPTGYISWKEKVFLKKCRKFFPSEETTEIRFWDLESVTDINSLQRYQQWTIACGE